MLLGWWTQLRAMLEHLQGSRPILPAAAAASRRQVFGQGHSPFGGGPMLQLFEGIRCAGDIQ